MIDINVIEYILDFGAIGVMAVGLWAFLTGRLISQKTHEAELNTQEKASEMAARIISNELCDKLEENVATGIERGIVRGFLRVTSPADKD